MAALKSILLCRVSKLMRHSVTTIFLPRSYCQAYSGYPGVGFCLSTGRWTGTSSTRHRRFLQSERCDFISPTLWPPKLPDLNLVNYSIWILDLGESLTIQNSQR